MRLRITFAKTADMRYTGHLDVYRAWERLIRRAGLPLAYTQGFSPHPRINLASALPLGFTSQAEVVDLWLCENIPPEQVAVRLRAASPPGLLVQQVEAIDEKAPTLQTILEASEFVITLLEQVEGLEGRVSAILQAAELPRERRGKAYNLRQLILGLEILEEDEEGHQRLLTRLAAGEGATGRPEELLSAMGIDPLAARVQRARLILRQPG
jgi:radical SAM-linked protein